MKYIAGVLALLSTFATAKTVESNLTIAEEQVNITGKAVKAMTINGGIPGPTLRRQKRLQRSCSSSYSDQPVHTKPVV